MGIIAVSRELAALGDETAKELSKLLGYRFVDKNTLEERIKSYGIEGQKFIKYDERKPSLFASLSQDRDDYLHYLKTAIFAEAEQGNSVFIGRGAGAVFKNMPALISLFLASPPDIRIERVKSYFQCDERRAYQIIETSDKNRAGFHRYFFDIDWRDPGNYHLSLNTGIFHPADCAKIVNQFKDRFFTPESEAQNAARLQELILEQRVKHCIRYEQAIPIHFLEVSVSGNGGNRHGGDRHGGYSRTITLHGVANSQALADAALSSVQTELAVQTAGLAPVPSTIHNEIQIVREYSVMP